MEFTFTLFIAFCILALGILILFMAFYDDFKYYQRRYRKWRGLRLRRVKKW